MEYSSCMLKASAGQEPPNERPSHVQKIGQVRTLITEVPDISPALHMLRNCHGSANLWRARHDDTAYRPRRVAFLHQFPDRSGSGRDTGRRLGQPHIHMRLSGARFIDEPRRSSKTTLRRLVRGRGTRTSERASSKHIFVSDRPSFISYPNSSTCAIAVKPML